MTYWTDEARAVLEERLAAKRAELEDASEVDPDEVVADLHDHVEEEVRRRRLEVVTAEHVAAIATGMGLAAGRPPAPQDGPAPHGASGGHRARGPAGARDPTRSGDATPERRHPLLERRREVVFGAVLSGTAVALEVCYGVWSGLSFDPMPTLIHTALLAGVPLVLFALAAVREERLGAGGRRALALLSGATLAVTVLYSVLFLPVAPVALMLSIVGIGLLPLAPYFAFAFALRGALRLASARGETPVRAARWLVAGFAAGALLLAVEPVRMQIVRHGFDLASSPSGAAQARGLWLLRAVADERDLEAACAQPPFLQLDGWLVGAEQGLLLGSALAPATDPEAARAVYFRVTGRAFDAAAASPRRGRWGRGRAREGDMARRRDPRSGTWLEPALQLAGSRIDARLDGDAALAYVEWTLVLRHLAPSDAEGRGPAALEGSALIDLPPGGVVSRLTLWIDGEPREAAFAERSRVVEAYRAVTATQRDPAIVTAEGPGRVRLRCFPIPEGGEMKVRLGITAPLALVEGDVAVLRLPRFDERNFAVPEGPLHAVWCEAPGSLEAPWLGLPAERAGERVFAVRGEIGDAALQGDGAVVRARRDPRVTAIRARDARDSGFDVVQQVIEPTAAARDASRLDRLVVVVEGSAGLAAHADAMAGALARAPQGLAIELMMAGDAAGAGDAVTSAPFSRERLAAERFVGGVDSVPAVCAAWDRAAAAGPRAAVLWIAGAQPVALSSVEPLVQRLERRPNGPRIHVLLAGAGSHRVLEAIDFLAPVRAVPRLGPLGDDLDRVLARFAGRGSEIAVERTRVAAAGAEPDAVGMRASSHLVRLWAADEIARRLAAGGPADRREAARLAAVHQVVTPVSGAVVLETTAQYARFGLRPVDADTAPQMGVPEPATWGLLGLGAAALLWQRRRRGSRQGARCPWAAAACNQGL